MNEVKSIFQSRDHKIRNASKAKLSPTAREIYLRGHASLGNAEELARSGFTCRSMIPAKES